MLYLTNYHFSRVGFTSLFSLWSVGIHNSVNASLKKVFFACELVSGGPRKDFVDVFVIKL